LDKFGKKGGVEMKRKILNFLPLTALVAAFIFGILLLYDWGFGEDAGESPCGALKEYSQVEVTGEFHTHNKGFAYIGDIFDFELRVVYDPKRVEIKERSMQNFNLAPYRALSQSDISTKDYGDCSEKRIIFTIQALNVYPGAPPYKNDFFVEDSEGSKREPRVDYIKDGAVGNRGPSYEELFIAPLTDGKVSALQAEEKKYLLPPEVKRGKSRNDIARFSLGIAMILGLATWVFAPYASAKFRRPKRAEQAADIKSLFPELFADSNIHECLVSAYFRLEEELDEPLRAKVRGVFSGNLTEVEEKNLIDELRKYVLGRYGNDGLA
jgi:hypothetical protein